VELHRGLLEQGVDSRIVAGLHINEMISGVPAVTGVDVTWAQPARARQAVTKVVDGAWGAAVAARMSRQDVYHSTWYPPWVPSRPTVVTTVYDMVPELYPELVARAEETTARKRRWCARAAHVLAISEHTKVDLVDRFGVPPERVTVTPLGVRAIEPDPAVVPPPGRFLLYVGDRRAPYKNFDAVLQALQDPVVPADVNLVCFGSQPVVPDDHAALARRSLTDRVTFEHGDDRRLAAYYGSAAALVYPSLYEGFGLPPLEAMVHGCPVVCSRVASLPEVVGDAAMLVDPGDVDELAAGIARVLDDDATRAGLIERGEARAAGYTWAATVASTLRVYETLVDGGGS
jgi:glycosyltransferase involved in cell wall biosynthesis